MIKLDAQLADPERVHVTCSCGVPSHYPGRTGFCHDCGGGGGAHGFCHDCVGWSGALAMDVGWRYLWYLFVSIRFLVHLLLMPVFVLFQFVGAYWNLASVGTRYLCVSVSVAAFPDASVLAFLDATSLMVVFAACPDAVIFALFIDQNVGNKGDRVSSELEIRTLRLC